MAVRDGDSASERRRPEASRPDSRAPVVVGPVLVGTDFSETSAVALQQARRLAELLHADLSVIHVVDGWPPVSWGASGEADQWLRSTGLDASQLVVRFGSPWVEVARYATELGPILVVVGSHGRSGYQPFSIGSTATRLTMQARCPVVVVSPRVGADTAALSRATAEQPS